MLDFRSSFGEALNVLNQNPGGVALPAELDDFFEPTGPMPVAYDDLRRFRRHYFRKQAILEHDGRLSHIYTVDLSRDGLSFLFQQQLYPLDQVTIWLESDAKLDMEVTRCRRIEDRCFQCGAKLLAKSDAEAEELLDLLKKQCSTDPPSAEIAPPPAEGSPGP